MILTGDAYSMLATLPSKSVQCCVTSPPYWGLRDYGVAGQLGLEKTVGLYIANMLMVFEQVHRVLRDDGTLWLNLGDSYARNGGTQGGGNRELLHMEGKQRRMTRVPAGMKEKDLVGIPWRMAFALQEVGWYLRQDIIWHKPNPMPESVRDRCAKAHEYIFLLTKSPKYYYDGNVIKEPVAASSAARYKYSMNDIKTSTVGHLRKGKEFGLKGKDVPQVKKENPSVRTKRSVWTVTTKPFKGAHFATFPKDLVEPMILAGSREGDTVLDPFAGAGTVGVVAKNLKRKFIGIELNKKYVKMAEQRIEASA